MKVAYKYAIYPNDEQKQLLEIRFQVLCQIRNRWVREIKELIKDGKAKAYAHNQALGDNRKSEFHSWKNYVELPELLEIPRKHVKQLAEQYKKFGRNDIDFERDKENEAMWQAIATEDVIGYLCKDFEAKMKTFYSAKKDDGIGAPKTGMTRYGYSYTTRNNHGIVTTLETGKVVKKGVRDASTDNVVTEAGTGARIWSRDVGYIDAVFHRGIPERQERITRLVSEGIIKTVTIQRTNTNKWFANFVVEFPQPQIRWTANCPLGIDVGLKHALSTSHGEFVDVPNRIDKMLKSVESLSRSMARSDKNMNPDAFDDKGAMLKGATIIHSNRYEKMRIPLALKHEHLKNQRDYFWHTVTDKLTKEHDLIVLEDLSLAFMQKNKRLAKRASDVALSTFRTFLQQKADERGVMVVYINPAYTSQACAKCEFIDKDNRPTQATFVCRECGHKNHADLNAAENVLTVGLRELNNAIQYICTLDNEMFAPLQKAITENSAKWIQIRCENILRNYRKGLDNIEGEKRKLYIHDWRTIYYAYEINRQEGKG